MDNYYSQFAARKRLLNLGVQDRHATDSTPTAYASYVGYIDPPSAPYNLSTSL